MTNFHIIQYKGYNVYYESPLYRIGGFPMRTYLSFDDAKKEIDKVLETFEKNIAEIVDLIKKNNTNGEANNKG